MLEICQEDLPIRPWAEPDLKRLPGMRPVSTDEWLVRDEVFAAQMAYRDWLVAHERERVLAEGASQVATEARDLVLRTIAADPGYAIDGDRVTRPDGVQIDLGADTPIATMARLAQEDICILEKQGDEHVLTAAALCFPASWSLAEKRDRPLMRIHAPVARYDANIGKRVQRLFDALSHDRVLMRGNYLTYADADLFQPRREDARRSDTSFNFLRVERQTLRKLPQSGAILFSIHSYVLPAARIADADRAAVMGE